MIDVRNMLRRLRKNQRGAAVIETALALPVLLTLSFGFIDLTQAFAFRMSLQEYSQAGADFVAASGEQVPTDSQIQSAVALHSGLPTSAITITRNFDCNGISASLNAQNCPNVTDRRVNYIEIDVEGTYDPMLSIVSFADFMSSTTLSASAAVRLP